MSSQILPHANLLQGLAEVQPVAAELLSRSDEEQCRLGYFHTFREICQQPSTWLRTGELMASRSAELIRLPESISSLSLTGSGSSEFAGDCVRLALRRDLGIQVEAVSAGAILTEGRYAMPLGSPALMVSLARSGDSPESVGALALIRRLQPETQHLVVTCNRQGRLANSFTGDGKVTVVSLDESTNDRSLVMTSSFTNMVLAARFLGLGKHSERYFSLCRALSDGAVFLLREHLSRLANLAKEPFERVLFLGSGAHFAAARETSLKMLEMTAGRVATSCQTYLGLRHGPMSAVDHRTLIVCFLSNHPTVRAYEVDVLKEISMKGLGMIRLIAGEGVIHKEAAPGDVMVPYRGANGLRDEDLPVLDVVVGQLLAFFTCLREGLKPDSPSDAGIIHRVVQGFTLHTRSG